MDVSPILDNTPWWSNWLFGGLGAITRVCYLKKDNEPLNPYSALATVISGTVFAGTGGTIAGGFGMGTVSISLSSFFAGMAGMVVCKAVMDKIAKVFENDSAR